MPYNIKATDITLTPEIREYLEKRLAHAERFMRDNPTAQLYIELAFESGLAGPKYCAEYTLHCDNDVYRSRAQGSVLHEAVDIASAELARELARAKDKRVRLVHRHAARVKEFIRGLRQRP